MNDTNSGDKREGTDKDPARSPNFIQNLITEDLASGRFEGRVHTRFPPEPNGYLHIGHAKAICLNFGISAKTPGGLCNLRFDDTNPIKEEDEFVRAIQADVRWLGFDWEDRLYYASDYFQTLYEYAEQLIRDGHAFVCDLSADQIREYRGTLTEPGRNSPFRERSVDENLDLFARMRSGEFADGARVLRARIDMASGNLNLRDPVMYRILRADHHRTAGDWCIYPTYDFAHGQSDSIERVTHSLCTLEFEDHRPLYDWYLKTLGIYRSRQIEFAPLNLSHTILSKRKLRQLVTDDLVDGWEDPRMPTLSGMRRRGFPPGAIRSFCEMIGVAKVNSLVDIAMLEHCVREELNRTALRVMGVLRPLRVIIENYPADQVEHLQAINNPEDPSAGTRKVPFSRVIYIERTDYEENPPKKYFRLAPGSEVRLRYGYYITCLDTIKDPETDEVVELRCTYDPETRGGSSPDGRKVRGTIHWVSATHALKVRVRLYEHLFSRANPGALEPGEDFKDLLNPDSVQTLADCRVEPSIADAQPGTPYQFERQGYFCIDSRDSSPDALVFNRTVSLRDGWAKITAKLNK